MPTRLTLSWRRGIFFFLFLSDWKGETERKRHTCYTVYSVHEVSLLWKPEMRSWGLEPVSSHLWQCMHSTKWDTQVQMFTSNTKFRNHKMQQFSSAQQSYMRYIKWKSAHLSNQVRQKMTLVKADLVIIWKPQNTKLLGHGERVAYLVKHTKTVLYLMTHVQVPSLKLGHRICKMILEPLIGQGCKKMRNMAGEIAQWFWTRLSCLRL